MRPADTIRAADGAIYGTAFEVLPTGFNGGEAQSKAIVFRLARDSTGAWYYTVLHHAATDAATGAPTASLIGSVAVDTAGGAFVMETTATPSDSGITKVVHLVPSATSGALWTPTVVYDLGTGVIASNFTADAQGGAYVMTRASDLLRLAPSVAGGAWTVSTAAALPKFGNFPSASIAYRDGDVYGLHTGGGSCASAPGACGYAFRVQP